LREAIYPGTDQITPLVEIKRLRYAYEGGSPVLQNISLTIPTGGIIALLGQNGSGKTTLAKTILRINEPPKGTVFFKGTDVCRFPSQELTRHIGYVFQNPDHQFVTECVEDEVAYSLRVRNYPEDSVVEKVERLLDIVDLKRYRKESPFSLSLGERRRLSVATMLVLEQELLILDEPTIGQDQERAQQLMEMMAYLCKEFGTTVLMITHDMRLVADWAHRSIVMSQGEIRFDGTPLDLFAQNSILEEAALLPPPLFSLTKQLHNLYPNRIEPTVSLSAFLRNVSCSTTQIA
jgi:energy-coupling factor transport system ATP-binding protein